MAEGFAHSMGWKAFSAGINPEEKISPFAVKVMDDVGIDISHHIPKSVEKYLNENFDTVVTVCDNANEFCPTFTGNCNQIIHKGFKDPYLAKGTSVQKLKVYANVRDEIKNWLEKLNLEYE